MIVMKMMTMMAVGIERMSLNNRGFCQLKTIARIFPEVAAADDQRDAPAAAATASATRHRQVLDEALVASAVAAADVDAWLAPTRCLFLSG